MSTNIEKLNFEQAITELEQIVRKLESGNAKLEESIKLYEKGNKLKKICQEQLQNARMKVEKVITNNSNEENDNKENLETEEFDAHLSPRI